MKEWADAFVNCTVTSPPYWGLRDYGIEPVQWPAVKFSPYPGLPEIRIKPMKCVLGLEENVMDYLGHIVLIFREVKRITTKNGVLFINVGDTYLQLKGRNGRLKARTTESERRFKQPAGQVISDLCPVDIRQKGLKAKDLMGIPWRIAFALQADGWYLRNDNVWRKRSYKPESANDRSTRNHEYVFMLSKSKMYYHNREAVATLPKSNNGGNLVTRTTVWDDINSTNYGGQHSAAYPPELAERCILAGCPVDGVVLDPFLGKGTTFIEARKLDRTCIGIEFSPKWIKEADKNAIANVGLFSYARTHVRP
ncbi:MAG TPA: site-specific DNA-methyltransferase [Chitinophagales bacterium]|nr:site-specific DNA-methyltransferase [Chitinophagales bacterium]